MESPPEKEEGASRNAPILKLTTGLPQSNSGVAIAQVYSYATSRGLVHANAVWAVWEREAQRLFAAFWRSGNEKHLRAFCAQVAAMRCLAGRPL